MKARLAAFALVALALLAASPGRAAETLWLEAD
jgi:hypothetical protein